MLYYSGYTRRIGDVDEGSTTTDFLPAERARGITIQSAAISFSWPPPPNPPSTPPTPISWTGLPVNPTTASSHPHNINLIDTPGHADFTFEVLRSLRVLDGAVCILDSVAGVEAQTEKVWLQASGYNIPRLIFVNKLDREGAAFGKTVREVGGRLGVWPAVCGVPWWGKDGGGALRGVGDVVNLRAIRYEGGSDGKAVQISSLLELEDGDAVFAAELKKARVSLVELLAEHDDSMVEAFLDADEDHLNVEPSVVLASLRRCIAHQPQRIVPVYPGASFRNIGVQPLLDAVVDLLPSPDEAGDPEISLASGARGGLSDFLSGKLSAAGETKPKPGSKALSKDRANTTLQTLSVCALAFKVVADPRRGVLVYVRVYSGTLSRNSNLWNTSLQLSERAQRLLKMYANDAVEVDTITTGQIGVIPGLKFARTGDTLVSYTGNPKSGPGGALAGLQLRPIVVPPPVFFVSVEASSLSEEGHIRESLEVLLREDPSLAVTVDEESGQTLLSGMGELHLEIARDRLVNDLRAKARIGGIEIGYREAITTGSGTVEEVYDREVGGKSSKGGCEVIVEPMVEELEGRGQVFELADGNVLNVLTPTLGSDGSSSSEETPGLPDHLPLPVVLQAFKNGAAAACARGPTHGYPIHSTQITLTFEPSKHLFPNTTLAALSSAARLAVQQALKASASASETVLMEPVMLVTISVPEDSLGSIVHDISSARGGNVVSLSSDDSTPTETGVDVSRIYAPPDPFAGGHTEAGDGGGSGMGETKQIVARVPLKEMVGYLKHLRSLTGGRGTFTMVVDRFERMGGQRQKVVLSGLRGDHG
ncbi:Ribosome-releasing factor 2, mitochondrial [Elasticomyces elasticus]|nr:Ribosome-releasing factor 2, mitochondrial [Elasticomyces elasticus]